jgi:hypothetical protein
MKDETNQARPSVGFILHPLVCLLGLCIAFGPTIASGFGRMQADAGDTLLNHYILEHEWQCLTRADYVGTWWSPPCFFPEPLTLAYSENLFGTAPVYWLLRTACSETLAFQLWMMVIASVTYAVMAWTLQRLDAGLILAALGAYLFAFGLPRLTQIGHQQLLPQIFGPPAVLFTWQFLRAPALGSLGSALVTSYLQILSSIYLGWFLVLGLAIFCAVQLVIDRETAKRVWAFLRRRWAAASALTGAWSALVIALFAVYAEANRGFHRPYSEVLEQVPRPMTWLATAPHGVWFSVLPEAWRETNSELWLFPGVVPLVLFGVGFAIALSRARIVGPMPIGCLVTAGFLMLLALRVGDLSPWHAVWKWAPGAQAIRAVGRVWTVIALFALCGSLPAIARSIDRKRLVWLGPIVLLFAVIEQMPLGAELPSFDVGAWNAGVTSIASRMQQGQPYLVRSAPGLTPHQSQLAAMWAGMKANAPVVNGYSGRYPLQYPDWNRPMTDAQLHEWLQGRFVGTVAILDPAK